MNGVVRTWKNKAVQFEFTLPESSRGDRKVVDGFLTRAFLQVCHLISIIWAGVKAPTPLYVSPIL